MNDEEHPNPDAPAWSDRDVEHARGILMNVPDVSRAEFAARRWRAAMTFVLWLVLTMGAAFVYLPLLFVGIIVGWFVLDAGVFVSYRKAQRDLVWAKTVFDDTGAELDDW